jgi:hypothetical protein
LVKGFLPLIHSPPAWITFFERAENLKYDLDIAISRTH